MKLKTSRAATRLTIYNHKGGVGKTTLAVNIGAALAARGRRVLLVDSDPQCNLTSFFFDDTTVDDLLDTSGDPNGRTIWSAVKPVFDGDGPVRLVDALPTSTPNLWVLPGDIRLSEFEQKLEEAWNECFKRRPSGFRTTATLSALIDQLSEKLQLDVVMYDTGPNIGPLNRAILLDCDAFIVPVACDLFSVRALTTLGQTLKTWTLDWETIRSLAPDNTELLPGKPRFIGYIPQRFKVYGRTMAQAPSYYLGKVKKQVYSDLVSVLRKVDKALAPEPSTDTRLGQVKEFNSLVQSAQLSGVPLWRCDGGTPAQRDEARVAFDEIADRLIPMLPPGHVKVTLPAQR